jgi:molybdate transport system substrate-binding protein
MTRARIETNNPAVPLQPRARDCRPRIQPPPGPVQARALRRFVLAALLASAVALIAAPVADAVPVVDAASAAQATPASSTEPVVIYAAGSLRNTLTTMSEVLRGQYHVALKLTFGPSGSLRQRIEHGERADLLLSADLGSPRQLASSGRTVLPVVAFARNAMCILSDRSVGLNADQLIKRMLQDNVRLKTSKPIADPSGDYAWAIFDRIDRKHPGAGAVLREKAQRSMNLNAPASSAQNATAALFADRQIDLAITYCSAAAEVLKALPELTSLPVPLELDPHPVYGAALLSERPEAMRVLLVLLSDQGQDVIAHTGLLPLQTPLATPQ